MVAPESATSAVILAAPDAIDRAEAESLADAELRARRELREAFRREDEDPVFVATFARAIREQFPACPEGEAAAVAEHACLEYSRRLERTAVEELAQEAVRLAVVAHIRHAHTSYDELLARYGERHLARSMV